MKNEVIKCIYKPLQADDWYVLEMESKVKYFLKLGGYVKSEVSDATKTHRPIFIPEYLNQKIINVHSDGQWVYILLDNNNVISSGFVLIDENGDMNLGLRFDCLEKLGLDFLNDPELYLI